MGIVFKGIRGFVRAFDGTGIRRRLQREQQRRMRRAVLLLRTEVIDYVDTERHGIPNSPLTILIKGSSKPLVDRGDLRQGVTTAVEVESTRVRGAVGILRRARNARGKSLSNVGIALHEGFTVRVTPEVRAAVFAEMRRRRGVAVPVGEGGGARNWRVRGRPFIKQPLADATPDIVRELGDGVEVTLRGIGK